MECLLLYSLVASSTDELTFIRKTAKAGRNVCVVVVVVFFFGGGGGGVYHVAQYNFRTITCLASYFEIVVFEILQTVRNITSLQARRSLL